MKRIKSGFSILIYVTLLASFSCKNNSNDSAKTLKDTSVTNKEVSIHDAAFYGQPEVIEKLIPAINIDTTDQDGRTALMYAAFNGHAEIVKNLIEEGATVDLQDHYGRTALMFGASGPYPEIVLLLLEHQADPNLRDKEEQFTALMYAAAEGQLEVAKILLEHHADPDLLDVDGDNAETFARNNGHLEVANLLATISH